MDEAVFSAGQVNPKIWFAPQSTPIEVKKKKIGFGAIAVAAAIDVRGKVIAYHIQDHSIDTDAYVMFLTRVRDYTKGRKCVMLVDNLRVHRTDPSKAACERFNIDQVFNKALHIFHEVLVNLMARRLQLAPLKREPWS